MKINPVNPVKGMDTNIYSGVKPKGAKKAAAGARDAYIPASAADRSKIEKLKKESERAYSHIRQLVEQLLREQGVKYKQALGTDGDKMVPVTSEMRTRAQALIAEGGELSAEKVSDRIVEFAKALSGGDKGKLTVLRGAIQKGFSEAERILGGLPDISRQTYDLVMQKLDAWQNE
jgi:hypothetical protein